MRAPIEPALGAFNDAKPWAGAHRRRLSDVAALLADRSESSTAQADRELRALASRVHSPLPLFEASATLGDWGEEPTSGEFVGLTYTPIADVIDEDHACAGLANLVAAWLAGAEQPRFHPEPAFDAIEFFIGHGTLDGFDLDQMQPWFYSRPLVLGPVKALISGNEIAVCDALTRWTRNGHHIEIVAFVPAVTSADAVQLISASHRDDLLSLLPASGLEIGVSMHAKSELGVTAIERTLAAEPFVQKVELQVDGMSWVDQVAMWVASCGIDRSSQCVSALRSAHTALKSVHAAESPSGFRRI